jgi:hypothetical protein
MTAYRKLGLMDVYFETHTEHIISVGTAQNLNVNSGGTCLLFGFKRLLVYVNVTG